MEGRLNVPDNTSEGGLACPSPVPKKSRKKLGRDDPFRMKGRRKDRSASTAGQDVMEGDADKGPYSCSGFFQSDFAELCQREDVVYVPQILPRARRPVSPGHTPDGKPERGKYNSKQQAPPEIPAEPLVDEDGEPVEPPPKTYTMKDKFEYFKPSIQVEMDNPDKLDTVTEVYIRGWRVDECMMNIFKQCWPAVDRLHTINLWQVGLTGQTVAILASIVSECETLKDLILDGNSVQEENWYQLIGDDSSVQTLSLQHCSITDTGVEGISRALGTAKRFNTKLLSLNLTGNIITDVGAEHLARGLRMNRRLMSLSLANNRIGDIGVKKIAEALSRFPLTHDEVVERRRLISEKEAAERNKPSTNSRRGDRSGTARSNSQSERDKSKRDNSQSDKDKSKRDNSQSDKDKTKKDNSQSEKDKSKRDKTPSKRSKEPKVREEEKRVPQKKEKEKAQEKAQEKEKEPPQKKAPGGDGKSSGRSRDKSRTRKLTPQGNEVAEVVVIINPLMETAEYIPELQTLLMSGNRILVNLNLARNRISDVGVMELTKAVQYQTTLSLEKKIYSLDNKNTGTGLMRICLHKNKMSPDSDEMKKLNDLMATKHPFYKPPATPASSVGGTE